MNIIKKIKKLINMSLDRSIEMMERKPEVKGTIDTKEIEEAFKESERNIKRIRDNIKRSQIN